MLSAQSVCDLFEEGILQAEEQAWPFISDSVGQQVFAHLFEREFFQPGALGDATESRVDVCDQKAAATIIRGLSLGEIQYRDVPRVLLKECSVAMLCGGTLALANFVKLLLVDRVALTVAAVVCVTLVAAILVANIVGSSLPILAKRLGLDPTVTASPLITTIVDAVVLMIYFNIAKAVLGI